MPKFQTDKESYIFNTNGRYDYAHWYLVNPLQFVADDNRNIRPTQTGQLYFGPYLTKNRLGSYELVIDFNSGNFICHIKINSQTKAQIQDTIALVLGALSDGWGEDLSEVRMEDERAFGFRINLWYMAQPCSVYSQSTLPSEYAPFLPFFKIT